MTHLHKKRCREFMLDYAKRSGKAQITRVQADTYEFLDGKLRDAMRYEVNNSVGKTVALTTRRRVKK